jgi:hypothetical protein
VRVAHTLPEAQSLRRDAGLLHYRVRITVDDQVLAEVGPGAQPLSAMPTVGPITS